GEPMAAPALRYAVTPGYFETMGIPLRRGRLFDAHDVTGAPARPVVISESYASRMFPGQDPIGQRLRLGGPSGRPWGLLVGGGGGGEQASRSGRPTGACYVP